MPRSTVEYLRHILDEAHFLVSESEGLTKEAFMQDDTLKRAFVRSMEIIGEASKQVPDNIREKYEKVEWRAMGGMRDRLIHAYFSVDYDIVWDVLINHIPLLQQEVEAIIRAEEE